MKKKCIIGTSATFHDNTNNCVQLRSIYVYDCGIVLLMVMLIAQLAVQKQHMAVIAVRNMQFLRVETVVDNVTRAKI